MNLECMDKIAKALGILSVATLAATIAYVWLNGPLTETQAMLIAPTALTAGIVSLAWHRAKLG